MKIRKREKKKASSISCDALSEHCQSGIDKCSYLCPCLKNKALMRRKETDDSVLECGPEDGSALTSSRAFQSKSRFYVISDLQYSPHQIFLFPSK